MDKKYFSNQFSWDSEFRTLTAEASMLGWSVGKYPLKFSVINDKSGKEISVEFSGFDRNFAQEIVGFRYENVSERIEVLVIND